MNPTTLSDRRPWTASAPLDLFGVVASSACLVHCLATPLIVASVPLAADARFEGALAVMLVAIGTVSALLALIRRRLLPVSTYGLGLAALALREGLGLPEGSPAERVVVVIAAALMITTHLLSLAAGRHQVAPKVVSPAPSTCVVPGSPSEVDV